jgi:hypothetical protein
MQGVPYSHMTAADTPDLPTPCSRMCPNIKVASRLTLSRLKSSHPPDFKHCSDRWRKRVHLTNDLGKPRNPSTSKLLAY